MLHVYQEQLWKMQEINHQIVFISIQYQGIISCTNILKNRNFGENVTESIYI